MPKSREFVESDDSSDSSSSEAEKRGKKRSKKDTKTEKKNVTESSSKKVKKDEKKENDDNVWDLGNNCHVTISEWKGKTNVNIRYMYVDKDSGDLKPSKKGVALNRTLWRKFMEVVNEVDEKFKEMC